MFFFCDKSVNIFFLGVFLDVDFSNDVPAPSVCIVVQAAGSIRPRKEYVLKGNGELFSYSPKSS